MGKTLSQKHTIYANLPPIDGHKRVTILIEPPPQQDPDEPSATEMAVNVTKALSSWIAAGAPVVDQPTYDARTAACEPCEYWDGSARLGLGKCKAPGCGAEFVSDGGAWAHVRNTGHSPIEYEQPDGSWVVA